MFRDCFLAVDGSTFAEVYSTVQFHFRVFEGFCCVGLKRNY